MTVPIAELVDACERMAARNRELFELTGGWVAVEADATAQRWWSSVTHRHAWHADLWSARRPAVPLDASAPTEPLVPPPDPADTEERLRWYLAEIAGLAVDAKALAERIDPELDPGTARVTRLVVTDLDDLVRTAPLGRTDPPIDP